MTEELVVEWLTEVWDRRPGALVKKSGRLILDTFKHLIRGSKNLVTSNLNTHLMMIPEGMRSQLRVHDMFNKPFRDQLCHLYEQRLLFGNSPLTQQEI
jgi:hypothetical protein